MRDEHDVPIAFTGAAADITDRKLAEERSQMALERLGAALDASRIGTYSWDARTNRVEHDDGVKQLFGFAPGEGAPVDDYTARIHEEDRAAWLAAAATSVRDGVDFHQEYRVVTPNGVRWLLDKAHVAYDSTGGTYMIGAVVDITEQKRLAEAALAASVAKDEFMAMLSHELRNPLAPIVTALDIMKMRDDPSSKERRTIERQVAHLVRLVDDLLDISRVTRGMIELARERLPIRDVIGKAIEMASPLIEQKQHHIKVDVPGGLCVDGDPVRLAQVFANLLTNAARYTNPGGTIEVVASGERRRVIVRVSDNGIGMDADLLPRVFDLFVQGGDRGKARSEGGLGIGLALVRNLVALHGGAVSAHSQGLGCGSTFTVELDAVAPDHARSSNALPAQTAAIPGRRVLIVDDNGDAAALLADALRAFGYDVAVAHDGPHALSLIETFKPEAAVLDIGLPVMDGYELARQMRTRGLTDCAFVALTGYGQEEDRARSLAAGFAAHLVKPVDIEQLAKVLDLTHS
jgi:signal transduction histidine kinase